MKKQHAWILFIISLGILAVLVCAPGKSYGKVTPVGDNLGNHKAVKDINVNDNDIQNTSEIETDVMRSSHSAVIGTGTSLVTITSTITTTPEAYEIQSDTVTTRKIMLNDKNVESILDSIQGDYLYYFTDEISLSDGYYLLTSTPSTGSESEIFYAGVSGANVVIASFTTNSPACLSAIRRGLITAYGAGMASAIDNDTTIHFDVYKGTGAGETFLFSTSNGDNLGFPYGVKLPFDCVVSTYNITLSTMDYITVHAVVTETAPGTEDMTFYMEGSNYSAISFPVLSAGASITNITAGTAIGITESGGNYTVINTGVHSVTPSTNLSVDFSTGTVIISFDVTSDIDATGYNVYSDNTNAVGVSTGVIQAELTNSIAEHRAVGVSTGVIQTELTTLAVSTGTVLPLSGGTMTGDIAFDAVGHSIGISPRLITFNGGGANSISFADVDPSGDKTYKFGNAGYGWTSLYMARTSMYPFISVDNSGFTIDLNEDSDSDFILTNSSFTLPVPVNAPSIELTEGATIQGLTTVTQLTSGDAGSSGEVWKKFTSSDSWGASASGSSDGAGISSCTASVLVSAFDATPHSKSIADFLCDGIADEITIETAVLTSSGGNVSLSEGTFYVNSNIVVTATGTTISGTGWGSIIKATNSASGFASGDGIIEIATNKVTVSNLCVDGNSSNNTATFNGITLHGIQGFCIERVKCSNFDFDAVTNDSLSKQASCGIITSCHFDTVRYGAYISISTTTISNCNYNTVTSGFLMETCTVCSIINNVIVNCGSRAMYFNTSDSINVLGNTLNGVQNGIANGNGIEIAQNCDYLSLVCNTIYDMDDTGITVTNANNSYTYISGNNINNCGADFADSDPDQTIIGENNFASGRQSLDIDSTPAKAGLIGWDTSYNMYVSTSTGKSAWVQPKDQ